MMDYERIVYELKGIESLLRIFKSLDMDVRGEDIARICEVYEERIQNIIESLETNK